MWRFAADENFKLVFVRGLLRQNSALDIIHVNDTGLRGADDATVLAWAAHENRVLLTHDIKTMVPAAYARLARGQSLPGVVAIPWTAPIGKTIEDLILLIEASQPAEWEGRVAHLPL